MLPIHFSTILAHNTTSIISQIARLSSKYGGRGHTILFALSANFPRSEDLQQVVRSLINFNDKEGEGDTHDALLTKGKGKSKGHTLGCLVGSFSTTSFEASSSGSQTTNDVLSCSIGVFHSDRCIPFRSTLAGRTPPQVGRWHSFRKKEEADIDGSVGASGLGLSGTEAEDVSWPQGKDGEVNWEEVWSSSASKHSLASPLLYVPDGLRQTDPSQVETILTLSSPHPDELTRTISKYLSSSVSNTPHYLCLIAAPTHFVTGREVTLILDGEIYSEGAVGVAFLRHEEQAKVSKSRSRTEFLGVKTLSRPMSVTSREGNMINELDKSNPTRLLLSSLSEAGIYSPSSQRLPQSPVPVFKDEEQFALGVLDAKGRITRAYKITAGDPASRGGSLSLDAPRAPEVGSVVQFLHQQSDAPVAIPASLFPSINSSTPNYVLGLLTVPELLSSNSSLDSSPDDTSITEPRILENTFLVPTTGGFVVSGKPQETPSSSDSDPTWSCSIPGGITTIEWS